MDITFRRGQSHRVTANVIEYLPLKSYLQRSTTGTGNSRTRSPDPPPSPRSLHRQDVYLDLVNSNSKFDVEKVFAKAPEFFKKKIGLPTRKKEALAPLPEDGVRPTRSTQSLYRPRVDTTNSEFQASKGGTHYYKAGGSGDSAEVGNIAVSSNASLVSTGTSCSRSSRVKTKPDWKYVGKCQDSFTSFKDYFAQTEPTRRRPEASKTSTIKRPLEKSCDEDGDFCSHVHHSNNTLNRRKKEKAESEELVFAVNGSVVSFKGFEYQNFTNWFAEPKRGVVMNKNPEGYRKELNFIGFTNHEISMKVYNGSRLVIEGSRPCRGHAAAKTVTEIIDLPHDLPLESLFMTRTTQGVVIIERAQPLPSAIS